MADLVLGARSDADIALDLMKYVVEQMSPANKPETEKDILALFTRCKTAIWKDPA